MFKMARLLTAVAVAVSLAACGSVDSPSNEVSENFTGTVDPLGQASNTFSVSKTGEMQLTLLSLTPRPVVGFIALAIGQPVGTSCAPAAGYVVQQAAVGQQYAFPQISKGSYCVLVADANGVLTASAVYTLRLLHP
jgi:outer membrane lipoprotein SlyB